LWGHLSLQQAAALSYYALLSLAPLLLIVVAVAGAFFSDEAVQDQLITQMRQLVGNEGASLAETILGGGRILDGGATSILVGAALMLFGASTVFAQLQSSLNRVWDVHSDPPSALLAFVRHRLLSAALVVSLGFLLMVSLVVDAILATLRGLLDTPDRVLFLWETANLFFSFVMITLLFAMLLKFLPDAYIAWRDVWFGSIVTALLFVCGKQLIGVYLGQASFGSWFGAAGSVVVLMIWTYYASVIFLLGAELTRAVARFRGKGVEPVEHAKSGPTHRLAE
jgi:membrane protein